MQDFMKKVNHHFETGINRDPRTKKALTLVRMRADTAVKEDVINQKDVIREMGDL